MGDEGEGKWEVAGGGWRVAGGAAEGDEAPTDDSGDGGGQRGGVNLEPSAPQPHDGNCAGYREHMHLGREEERCPLENPNERCGRVPFSPSLRYNKRYEGNEGVQRQATQPCAYSSQRQAGADDDMRVVQGEGGERGGSDGTNKRCGRVLFGPSLLNDKRIEGNEGVRRQATPRLLFTKKK